MKHCLALVFSILLLLPFFALAESNEWLNDYASLDSYPPIVFDNATKERISGPPGGAMLAIEGTVYAQEKNPESLSIFLLTDNEQKWVVNGLDLADENMLLDETIQVYGTYTGIAPVYTEDPKFGFMPSMWGIRYVLNDKMITPKLEKYEFFFNKELYEKYTGKYRYEAFEGKMLGEIKDLLGGLFLCYEHD